MDSRAFHSQVWYQYRHVSRTHVKDPTLRHDGNSTRSQKKIPKPFSPSPLKELRQLIRHRGIHLGNIKVIEVLWAANGLSLGQHLLDEGRELDRADGILVEYLVGIKCMRPSPSTTMSTDIHVEVGTYLSPAFVFRRFVDIPVQLLKRLVPEQTQTTVAWAGSMRSTLTNRGGRFRIWSTHLSSSL